MKSLLIALAVAALPIVFFTMYSKTSEGLKLPLGSFFVIRKLKHDFLRVRSLKDILLLILRIIFVILLALLVIDPIDVEAPPGNIFTHKSAPNHREESKRYTVRFISPDQVLDKFDEDLFFLESFVKNFKTSGNISIIYNPTEKTINSIKGDIVIFPSKKQGRNAFQQWIEIFDFSQMRTAQADLKIRHTDIAVKTYYPVLILDAARIKKYAETTDGSAIAVSFTDGGRRVLLFSTGLSAFWGDVGVSGYFIEIIEKFINNNALSSDVGVNDHSTLPKDDKKDSTGRVTSLFSFSLILKIACIIFLIELIHFLLPRITQRFFFMPFVFFVVQIFFIPVNLKAEDFKFIELTQDGQAGGNALMFSVIKRELEDKTSIRISSDFYRTHSANALINGDLPELPYLWIFGCGNLKYSPALRDALFKFVARGGILFVDSGYGQNPSPCTDIFKDLGVKVSGIEPVVLGTEHPIFKSFYLIYNEKLSGADASLSTKRTALIIFENDFRERVIKGDAAAIKTGINIVLYMLSGNYKSDQIHTRYILERLKKRELFK